MPTLYKKSLWIFSPLIVKKQTNKQKTNKIDKWAIGDILLDCYTRGLS